MKKHCVLAVESGWDCQSWTPGFNVQHCCCVTRSTTLCLILFLCEFMHKMLLFLSLSYFFYWTLAVLCVTPSTIPTHRKYNLASSVVHLDKAQGVQVIQSRISTASSCFFFKEHTSGNITMKISPVPSQSGTTWGICTALIATGLGFPRLLVLTSLRHR